MKRMEREYHVHEFGPFFRPDSRILILGSFPSVKSRETGFYYGHPQNRFWKIMARICRVKVPATRPEKEFFLEMNRIALYDVIESCEITGSSDSSIKNVTPSDLAPILAETNVGKCIFTNGGTASRLYRKYQFPKIGIAAVQLPSSSPANAAWSLDRLSRTWEIAFHEAGFPR